MNLPVATQINSNYKSSDWKESNFGIRSQADLVHIFNVLRNKMYTNKVMAVLREYSTNACDAHIESGQKDRPINVTLPTNTNRFLTIRDFGTGLNEDQIRNTYAMYGASTKRGSTELNGQLGFGSKAAFSYTDTFLVTSYMDGKKYVYEAYIDETGLGAITQILVEDTAEPNGIEIKVSIQPNDISNFVETASKLYKYFTVTPNVVNGKPIVKPEYKLKSSSWGLKETTDRFTSNELVAVMGNIGYPLNSQVIADSLRNAPDWKKYEALLKAPINFFVPVGSLNIAASREALEYDKKTLRNLQEIFNTAITEISAEFQSKMDKAKDIVEAKQLYKLLVYGELSSLAPIIGNKVTWNGKSINSSSFALPNITYIPEGETEAILAYSVKIFHVAKTAIGYRSFNGHSGSLFEIDSETKVLHQDTNDKPLLRIRNFLSENPKVKSILLIKDDNITAEAVATSLQIPFSYFTKLSTVQPMKIEYAKSTAPSNVKHSKKIFKLATTPSQGYGDSVHWEVSTVDAEEEFYYVYLDRFQPALHLTSSNSISRYLSNDGLRSVLTDFQALTNTEITSKIVGIKLSATDKIPANWKPLETILDTGIAAAVPTVINSIERTVYRDLNRTVHEINLLNSLGGGLPDFINRLNTASPLRTLLQQHHDAQAVVPGPTYDRINNIHRILQSGTNATLDIAIQQANNRIVAQARQVVNRYPLLRWIASTYNANFTVVTREELAKYIRLIDSGQTI